MSRHIWRPNDLASNRLRFYLADLTQWHDPCLAEISSARQAARRHGRTKQGLTGKDQEGRKMLMLTGLVFFSVLWHTISAGRAGW